MDYTHACMQRVLMNNNVEELTDAQNKANMAPNVDADPTVFIIG